jgi:trimeric autotransporter adhesin
MTHRTLCVAMATLLLGLAGAGPSTAQTFTACYVPAVGALYLIQLEGLPSACLSEAHVQISWTEGNGETEHGALTGLENDDHPQYLLTDGTRAAIDGFAVTGTADAGAVPIEGPGIRLMWYPGKAAFRAGQALGDEWDDAKVGLQSVAMGRATTASGHLSIALGDQVVASGLKSTAIGSGGTLASGELSLAWGSFATASGHKSVALGSLVSTNGFDGSFAYGDGSIPSIPNPPTRVMAENSFVVRAQRFWFGKSGNQVVTPGRYIETSTGAFLSDGGEWTNASDAALKENFRDENANVVLAKLARLPVRSWNYRAEDPGVRHLGPTAQDFHAAFGLGGSDRAIGTVDASGVALLAIQALEARTRELASVRDRVARLERANAALRAEFERLRARLAP